MLILGLETTCDETGAAVIKDGREILSNIVASQIDIHRKYGGVVPEIAARKHLEALPFVVESALEEANVKIGDIDAVAISAEPGLPPALVTGYAYASGLALSIGKPLIPVNHLEAHVHANWLKFNIGGKEKIEKYEEIEYPYLCLLVSGGHTELLLVTSPSKYTVVGETHDDAAGEAFDKVARLLDLPYPGGVEIDKISKEGDERAYDFPRPLMKSEDSDFSFSGLKTAVAYKLKEIKEEEEYDLGSLPENKKEELSKELRLNLYADIAASFQEAVVDTLVYKTVDAAHNLGTNMVVMAGGVAANSRLREMMTRKTSELEYELRYPELSLCVDNAAMVGGRAFYDISR